MLAGIEERLTGRSSSVVTLFFHFYSDLLPPSGSLFIVLSDIVT